jgi:methylenetetrahydrofolate reductase (NADH)
MTLRAAIHAGRFVLTTELPAVADAARLLDFAAPFADLVDALEVAEGPASRPHLSPLIAAATLRQAGHDPLLHLTCRDRNRVALQGDLLGAANLGIESLLITRGTHLRTAPESRGEGVFDMGATDLIAAARALADTESPRRFGVAQAPNFFVGGAIRVFDPVADWQPNAPLAKIRAGAQFLLTQPCLDVVVVRRYMDRLVGAGLTRKAHVIVTVPVLSSIEMARRLRDNVRGVLLPEEGMRRLRQSSDPGRTGVELCAEALRELAAIPGVSGAHLATAGEHALARAAIADSGVRSVRREPD